MSCELSPFCIVLTFSEASATKFSIRTRVGCSHFLTSFEVGHTLPKIKELGLRSCGMYHRSIIWMASYLILLLML